MTETIPSATSAEINVDPEEIRQFDRIAGQWWDPTGPFKPLHDLAPARLGFIREAIDSAFATDPLRLRPLTGKTVLDVGCGGGLVSEPLARLGGSVTGIDLGEENIAVARRHAEMAGFAITYDATSAEALAARGDTFDVVTCLEVIEHVPDQSALITTLAQLVAPGGVLFVSTLNRTAKAYALAIVGAEYVFGWLDRGTHTWSKFVTLDEMRSHLAATDLNFERVSGLTLNVATGAWTQSSDTDVNYILSARKAASRDE